jgi:hypothetical protein
MQPAGEHFQFDVADYTISAPPRYVALGYPLYSRFGWWDPWYGPRIGFGFELGRPYHYRPFFGPGRWYRW